MAIVPKSYMADDFFNKTQLSEFDSRYNLITQFETKGFEGVDIDIKVIIAYRNSSNLPRVSYTTRIDTYETAANKMQDFIYLRSQFYSEITIENNRSYSSGTDEQEEEIKRLLFQIRMHGRNTSGLTVTGAKSLSHQDRRASCRERV